MMQHTNATFHSQVKAALAHWHNLAYLGNCSLAGQLLPALSLAPEERGRLLQQVLREAIERLRPCQAGDGERLARPYYVLYYKYIERRSNQAVLDALSISSSTLLREQRAALALVCAFLKEKEQSLRAPPLSPCPLPRAASFIGREKELAACRRSLDQDGLAVIAGPPGAGKTVLGAELATGWQAQGRPVVWITLCNGQNTAPEALLEAIALALAAAGQPDYWRFLQAERHAEFPLSPQARVRYLLTALEAGDYLLCLDDFHLANGKPAVQALCSLLLRSARHGQLRLLVMSRTAPPSLGSAGDWLVREPLKPLGGLGREDSRHLLETCGLEGLPEAAFAELYARTAGLPIFLQLIAAWARRQGLEDMDSEPVRERLAAFAGNMVKEQSIRGYLLHQVYASLSSPELSFLTCAAAFRLPFDTQEPPIIALLEAEGVPDIEATWMALAECYIFSPLEEQDTIVLHPLVRAYLAQRLRQRPQERVRLHRRIGEYYERNVEDALEAGYHYTEAGEVERAARVLGANVLGLINAGQAELALEQLEQLAPCLASAAIETRFEAAAAREKLCGLLGLREKQKAALETLTALAKELGEARRQAEVHNRRARFYEAVGEYPAALAAAEAGQAAARRAGNQAAEAESLVLGGQVLWRSGEYDAAREQLEQALAQARAAGDRLGQAKSLSWLGITCWGRGELNEAWAYFEQALALRRALGDRRGEASELNNLGLVRYEMGNYVAAQACYEQSLAARRALGDRRGEALGLNNVGNISYELGDYAAARTCHEQSLAIKRAIGDRGGEGVSLNNLGMICREEEDYAAARTCQEQALAIAQAITDRRGAGYALAELGLALEGLAELGEAEEAYREAMAIRRKIGQVALAIENVAGLARVQGASGRMQEAKGYVEECLAYIAANGVAGIEYVFKVYLTCVRVLEACGERERTRGVLEEAHTLLMERASRIEDEALRRSYLENVPAHREVMRAWAAALK